MFNFHFENEEGEKGESSSKSIQKQKDFSAIFAMSKVGKLYMLPKVEEEHEEMKVVEPIRIMEDEFCGPKEEGDVDVPYTADFVFYDNQIYMVTINKPRKKFWVYQIKVKS